MFPNPEVLARLVRDAEAVPHAPTWREGATLPPLAPDGLRPAQAQGTKPHYDPAKLKRLVHEPLQAPM